MGNNGLKIMWLIGGEKQIYSPETISSELFGWLIFNGVYWLENNRPVGCLHFDKKMSEN